MSLLLCCAAYDALSDTASNGNGNEEGGGREERRCNSHATPNIRITRHTAFLWTTAVPRRDGKFSLWQLQRMVNHGHLYEIIKPSLNDSNSELRFLWTSKILQTGRCRSILPYQLKARFLFVRTLICTMDSGFKVHVGTKQKERLFIRNVLLSSY